LLVGKQLGFSDYEQSTSKQRTKRENFLAEIEQVVPLQALLALIEPWYPKSSQKGGRSPYSLFSILRITLCSSGTASAIQHGMGAD
jgi:IS5 family transposase